MDTISIIGIVVSVGAILGGQLLEGGHVMSLVQLTAFIIVLGGTAGAVMLQSSPKVFMRGLAMISWVFSPPKIDLDQVLSDIVDWAQVARREGLLSLERVATELQSRDPFMAGGLQLLVDGTEPHAIQSSMEIALENEEERMLKAARIWESAGGYAPTIGILGAVLGLIHVMESLADPSKLGAGIAVAFVATVYGVGSANLLFLPIAKKLESTIEDLVRSREMQIHGMLAIANGENPRLIESKLLGFIETRR